MEQAAAQDLEVLQLQEALEPEHPVTAAAVQDQIPDQVMTITIMAEAATLDLETIKEPILEHIYHIPQLKALLIVLFKNLVAMPEV
jgi:hypothetical protein